MHTGGISEYAPKDSIAVENMPSAMNIGDSLNLVWSTEYYSSPTVTWSSNDESIISVSSEGVLTAHNIGNVQITAKLNNGSSVFAVSSNAIPAATVNIAQTDNRIEIHKALTLTASLTPENTTDKSIHWSSSDINIATVSDDGIVTGLALGNVSITATAKSGVTKIIPLEIYEIQPTELVVDEKNLSLTLYSSFDFNASVLPDNTTNPEIIWTIKDNTIASITNGSVTSLAVGETIITATCQNVSIDIPLDVYSIPATDLSVSKESLNLIFGKFMIISKEIVPKVNITPQNATNKDYKLTSSDESVVSVKDNKFVSVNSGLSTITVSNADVKYEKTISVISMSKLIGYILFLSLIVITAVIFIAKTVTEKYKTKKCKISDDSY